jgi:hypothetical protein
MAWLVVNACRSERLQYNQLQIQDVANVWRRRAFDTLQRDCELLTSALPTKARSSDRYKRLLRSLRCFEEAIDFRVTSAVPRESIDFEQAINARIDAHRDLLEQPAEVAAVDAVRARVRAQIVAAEDRGRVAFESNQTLEQEQEQEQEQEREQEQEIEIEKFQDLAYARDNEEPVPWQFRSLGKWDDLARQGTTADADDACRQQPTPTDDNLAKSDRHRRRRCAAAHRCGCVVVVVVSATTASAPATPTAFPPQFYAASDFHLHRRRSFPLPDDVLVSENYFNPRWSGERRIKNIVAVLEWTPDTERADGRRALAARRAARGDGAAVRVGRRAGAALRRRVGPRRAVGGGGGGDRRRAAAV